MSEVQKILEDFGLHLCSQDDAEQALYTLLMEKMPKKLKYAEFTEDPTFVDIQATGVVTGHNQAVREMVSTLNKLFGRTE